MAHCLHLFPDPADGKPRSLINDGQGEISSVVLKYDWVDIETQKTRPTPTALIPSMTLLVWLEEPSRLHKLGRCKRGPDAWSKAASPGCDWHSKRKAVEIKAC